MIGTALFFLFAGLAIACAISMVYHRNPLYSAISLVGVFISLSCIYVTLAAPFIAAVQILIYAGAIMVLVVFVIMLLNLDDEGTANRLRYLYALGAGLGVSPWSRSPPRAAARAPPRTSCGRAPPRWSW